MFDGVILGVALMPEVKEDVKWTVLVEGISGGGGGVASIAKVHIIYTYIYSKIITNLL